MKKYIFYYLLVFVGIILIQTGCSDDAPVGDYFADEQYNPKGTVISAGNVVNGFFDLTNIATSFIEFDVDQAGEGATGANILASYEGGGFSQVASVSGFPSTVNISAEDLISSLGLDVNNIEAGDNVLFVFDATGGGSNYRSNRTLNIPFSCSSNLGGTFPYVSSNLQAANGYGCPTGEITGEVTFTDEGGGTYHCSDLGFGQYGTSCWNDSPASSPNATFQDVCNEIVSGGLDQYDLAYTWVITDVSGPDLFISWTNTYDDSGDVVISRTDGTNWPALFTN